MGQKRGLRSVVVEMEDDDDSPTRAHPEPLPTTMDEMNRVPPSSINHHNHSDSATRSTSQETYPQRLSNYRKLDTAERRQLRAQLRGSAEVDKGLLRAYEKVVGSPENLDLNLAISHAASLNAAENGESIYVRQERVEFAGEGVGQGSTTTATATTTTTSTDSEIEISRHGDKMSTVTNMSRSSDDSKTRRPEDDELTCGVESTDTESADSDVIRKAWSSFEKSRKLQIALTQEEKRNGYRLFPKVDPLYLGFCPRASDKRKYLKAYPIVGPIPAANMGWSCPFPMTFGQWSFVIGLTVVFTGLGLGVYFYFRTQL